MYQYIAMTFKHCIYQFPLRVDNRIGCCNDVNSGIDQASEPRLTSDIPRSELSVREKHLQETVTTCIGEI